MPGVFIEHGCVAKHSVAKHDLTVFWLSKDKDGQGVVIAGKNYAAGRISTHAIEQEFSTYSRLDDAIGYTYQQGGHPFYVLSFPTANRTWVFDMATDCGTSAGIWRLTGRSRVTAAPVTRSMQAGIWWGTTLPGMSTRWI
jgi:hypothetical protein